MTSQRLGRAASIDDLRVLARRRIPRFAFDFIDGGAEAEIGLRRNRTDLEAIELTPRYMRDVSDIGTETEIFGQSYSVPFGAAPIGFLNTAWPGTDVALARIAAGARMPFGISTAASTQLEKTAEAGEGFGWFQLYLSDEPEWIDRLLARVKATGIEVLILTVDVSQPGKRDRDIRNGLSMPLKPTPKVIADLALHPHWSLKTLINGAPRLANFDGQVPGALSLAEIQRRFLSGVILPDQLRQLRDKWAGKLLIKGIMHPQDAELVVDAGCDGVIVSNHGGRQADYAPSSISVLPKIAAAIGDRATVILDSGIRRGADMVRARALGADAVMGGRPFAYGAAAGGPRGITRAFEILNTELRFTLGQIGTPKFADIGPDVLA